MTKSSYLVDVQGLAFEETNGTDSSWVHALPLGSYKHPIYGTIDITVDRVKNFADGIKNKVRGTVEPSINYVHDNSNVAAGWVKNAEPRSDGLWLFVEWVKDAAQAIKDKKWRYFSSEFEDEWTDTQGAKHKDVILGGALTNRPFMKNLVPINLSEGTVDLAFDLVAELTGVDKDSLKGGNGMGLSEEDMTKLVEQLATKLGEKNPTPPAPVAPSVSLMDIPELKELAETNPMVKLLIDQVEKKNAELAQGSKALKEAEITAKLSEFDRSKIVLTPVAKELTAKLATEMPSALTEDFWKLLTEMKRGSTFLVELGERAGATVNYGTPKSYVKQFNDLATTIKNNDKNLSDADAFEAAASQDPTLYGRYRAELMTSEVK